VAQDGTVLPLTITAAAVGLIWHATSALTSIAYAGLEKAKANFANVGTVPFGYGNPLYNTPAASPRTRRLRAVTANTKEVRQITAGIYDTIYQGNYGTLKAGVQYSYTQRIASTVLVGAPRPTTTSS